MLELHKPRGPVASAIFHTVAREGATVYTDEVQISSNDIDDIYKLSIEADDYLQRHDGLVVAKSVTAHISIVRSNDGKVVGWREHYCDGNRITFTCCGLEEAVTSMVRSFRQAGIKHLCGTGLK